LVKTLEEFGVGRPSTYAPTISTIIDRGYVERDDNKKLFPTEIAYIVNDLLVEHFPNIVDYQFTAKMEKQLDDIAEGETAWVPMLKEFFGPFHDRLAEKSKSLSREDILKERIVGQDPKTGLDIIARGGRFGPFVQLGEWAAEDKKNKINKPRSASLTKEQTIDTVTLEQAMHLLELPKILGQTKDGDDIMVNIGRFGPYLKAGKTTVSLKPPHDPYNMDLATAQTLLTQGADLPV